MRKISAIIIFTLSATCFAQNHVYVCTSSTKTKYHQSKRCSGLKKCHGTIRTLTLQEALATGHKPCKKCAKTSVKPSKIINNAPVEENASSIELAKTNENTKFQVIWHFGYVTSYNPDWLIPNWVAYDLTSAEVADQVKRPNKNFEPDPQVKGKTAYHNDYSGSGYSRGHMAPAGDMKWSEQAMDETFYLSNICPQNTALNGGVWERLEKRVRALAKESTVYICCGPIVPAQAARIGKSRVAVPTEFFKVLCMQRRGRWQAIGFIFPNSACKGSIFDYALPVDEVEKITGHDFFYNLPDEIETDIESDWNMKFWQ